MFTGELIQITEETLPVWEADFEALLAEADDYKKWFREMEGPTAIARSFGNGQYVASMCCPEDVDDLLVALDVKIAVFRARLGLLQCPPHTS